MKRTERSWQMRNHKPPADKRHHGGAPAGILRTDLLTSRFSETEIQRLSRLQLRYRERPDARDMPIEESRLQFAHWLVEQGRLSEDDGSGVWKRLPESPEDMPDGCVDGEMASARRQHREVGHRPLFGALSWVRQGLTRAAGIGRGVGRWLFLPGEPGEAIPWEMYGQFPYTGPWSGL
jgi:hypothetical protein